MAQQTVLVTGGAGYVGSHTVVELLQTGYSVVVVDNCCNAYHQDTNAASNGATEDRNGVGGTRDGKQDDKNGHSNGAGAKNGEGGKVGAKTVLPVALERVEDITGKTLAGFYLISLLDEEALTRVFSEHKIDAVIHFAALKAVGESVAMPLEYYINNVAGTLTLLQVMRNAGVKRLVYSSSATVYGLPQYLPTDEDHPTGPGITNPYGRSKYFCEQVMTDLATADKVAVGRRDAVQVFGQDYPTPDGTGVRDYVHVMDLASGHVAALGLLWKSGFSGAAAYNLGSGKGVSVLEMIHAFTRASGRKIPYVVTGRRAGDVAKMVASCTRAQTDLGWKATRTLDQMCEDTWRWQSQNPQGYA